MIKFGQKLKSSDERNYFITSDLHFFHKRILDFCSETRPWQSLEEMHEFLIVHWNSKVSQDDIVFHLGDFSFGNKEQTLDILSQLNGNIVHIYGNHAKVLRDQVKVIGYDYLEVKYDKTYIVMNHYPQYVWNRSHYGSVMMFGHCVDLETEILTKDGFKLRADLLETDQVYSYDPTVGKLTLNPINQIIELNYTGEVVSVSTPAINFRVTSEHTLVGINKSKGNYEEVKASEWTKRSWRDLKFIKSGEYINNIGIDFSDDELILYVALAADGSVVNTDLGRFRFSKVRKVDFVVNLLDRMKINYTKNTTKDGMININFTVPPKNIKIKYKRFG